MHLKNKNIFATTITTEGSPTLVFSNNNLMRSQKL